ncbi:TonB-dependent receptor plug domain-containing protein [Hylemonella gracilis]|uniref:TonB-dependent receptor plug domain-containing protein n=1 Tax=Hylemonella gracilis TaxID=80880 RepID=UPI001F619CF0|nr:TonB-dependent receptor plug domain-containing protein [Hylemonella gracilis]
MPRPFRAFLALAMLVGLAFKTFAASGSEYPSELDPATPESAREADQSRVDSPPRLLSEQDYLEPQVPVVLTVSRLPQRLDEVPGAVTVIDRETIRASGARDVADLLRMVPGFSVSNSFEEGASAGSYHGLRSTFPNQMQLLVDGRSVYSLHLGGSVGPGLQTVALDDIERIEIFRGPNSATYGARAFLGSINIITRDLVDTQGVVARFTRGVGSSGAGVNDWGVRLGGVAGGSAVPASGDEGMGIGVTGWRLSADQRLDDGLRGAGGPVEVQRINVRADANYSETDQLSFRAGQSRIESWLGKYYDFPGLHTRGITTSYAQVDWNRNLDDNADLSVQLSHTDERVEERERGTMPYPPQGLDGEGVLYDRSGRTSSTNFLVQQTRRLSPALRGVWGGELRRETSDSYALYATNQPYVEDFTRLFGNVEWHLSDDWLLNAGALIERSTMTRDYETAPRLMLNWNVGQTGAARHTLRTGVSRAFRPASMFERKADVRYHDPQTDEEIGYEYDAALGDPLRPERVDSVELGWLVDAGAALSFDLRLFQERVHDVIVDQRATKSGGQLARRGRVFTYANGEDFDLRGAEAQMLWQPWRGAQLRYAHAQFTSERVIGRSESPEHRSHSLLFAQRLPGGWSFSVWDYYMDRRIYPNNIEVAPSQSRVDMRLAKAVNLGSVTGMGRQAELALTVQNMDGPDADDVPEIRFQRRVYLTLQMGY